MPIIQQLQYIIPFLISIAILSWSAAYAWRRRRVAGAREFSLHIMAEMLWVIAFTLELLSPSLKAKLFWDDFQWACVLLVAITFAVFVLRYAKGVQLNRKTTGQLALVCFPLITYSISDGLHHSIRYNVQVVPAIPFDSLIYDFGWGTYLLSAIGYLITIWGIVILVKRIFRGEPEFIRQSSTILIGILIPTIGSTLTLFGVDLFQYRDTTPFTFALGGIVVIWGLFRYGLFDVVPVALRSILDTIDDAVFVFDNQRRVVFMNDAGSKGLQVGLKDVIGKTAKDIFPNHDADVDYFRSVERAEKEIETVDPDGQKQQYMVKLLPLPSDQNHNIGRVIVLQNITKFKTLTNQLQKQNEQIEAVVVERTAELEQRNLELQEEVQLRSVAEAKIKANLEEKTALVQEINHRVRNNMAIIMSLLNMQTQYMDSSSSKKPIMEIHNRIYSMSLIHTMMYHTGDFKHVSLSDYLHRLYSHLIHQKRKDLNIGFSLEMNDITLPIDKAIPVGLIFNELISNSILHAYPRDSEGEICITGELLAEDQVKFSIGDSGIGFDATIVDKAETFGLKMVRLLIEQLAGKITFSFTDGAQVAFSFNMRDENSNADIQA